LIVAARGASGYDADWRIASMIPGSRFTIALGPSSSIPALKEKFIRYQRCWKRGEFDSAGNIILDEPAKVWHEYDLRVAREAFIGSETKQSFFEAAISAAMQTDFRLTEPQIGVANVRGKWVTTVSFSSDQIRSNPPIAWPPPAETLNAIMALFASVEGRDWVEWFSVAPEDYDSTMLAQGDQRRARARLKF
jgi:hypothetical protein